MIIISPSVLAADFSRLGEELKKVELAGAEYIHLDVMDGQFVPNISFGAPVISAVRKSTSAVFDVHLMIVDPERYIDDFITAGADLITIHYESTKDPVKQGLWGMFEVFATTIVICTMSALVILTSDVYGVIYHAKDLDPALNGASLSGAAFNEAIPVVGQYGVTIATIFFSLSTILGWAYYGEVCVGYVFNKQRKIAIMVYRLVYVSFVFVGAIANIGIVWTIADCFNVLMALPNLIAIIVLSKTVKDLTKEHFSKNKGLNNQSLKENI